MTTTDARKRNRDMADAHETARARDERGGESWNDFLARAYRWAPPSSASITYLTRTHSISPETGEFTPLDFHREWLHVMDTQHPHTPQETDMPNNQRRHREQMGVLDQIHDTLTEIRDRLPERVEVKVAPFDPDLIAANLEAIKHEVETPMRGHGECCEPLSEPSVNVTETPDLSTEDAGTSSEPADITEEPPGEPVEPGDLRAGDRVSFTWRSERTTCNLVDGPLAAVLYPDTPCSSGYRPSVAYHGREWAFGVTDVRLIEPAPADVDPDEAGGEEGPEPKAELDEVEALAKAIHWADDSDPYNWPYVKEARRGEYRSMARVAREFIEAERSEAEAKRDQWKADVRDAAIARADKAEADLARVTEERDTAERLANRNADTARDFEDRYETSHAYFLAVSSDLDKAQAKADRYDALRADVVDYQRLIAKTSAERAATEWFLDRDDERAES